MLLHNKQGKCEIFALFIGDYVKNIGKNSTENVKNHVIIVGIMWKVLSLRWIINYSVSDWYTNSECGDRKVIGNDLATLRLHQSSYYALHKNRLHLSIVQTSLPLHSVCTVFVKQLWYKNSQNPWLTKEFGYFLSYNPLL